jgi:outer membrane protein assembly factor BamD
MNKIKPISLIIIILLFYSCSTEEKKISTIKELDQNQELITTYNEAYKALELGDPYFAAQKFSEAELLYPQSEWAAKSALMASYSYYMQNFYPEALSNLERYLKTYPSDANIAYAHYLMAICYYETIEDEKRDIAPLLNARSKFNYILENYPNTDFALDSKFKLDLINDILAAKEMYLGRHYVKKTKWIAAINRFKTVIDDYDQSIFAEEALHRLVEIYYKLGLIEESEKYASVLGYNYLSSEWYKKTYKIFNQDYDSKAVKTLTKDKKGVFNKFKKLFE